MEKKDAIRIINQSAKLFQQNLEGKDFLFIYRRTDEKEFKRTLAARIYSNSGFTSIKTGKPIDANTIAKDAINKANVFWDALPKSWKKE